ncbi:MAG: Stp1/IreP family PP2C-type Ser/Thr phosphatase [Clostridiales bacterium]|jgi:protein phosphatase|nr:Stp1/IreP family PP2C-type Ser/Thr phosphatase [Clostridiales bacterium]HOJ36032.1 Stp1/IreP family PP2C-type Ser/Thr phosphatase [Clostridiales bacterium]HOL79265.1 Stp1/IreP family PP2C-type Ser/Thr phosphatase [Clostridiales bacterium]HPP68442.1 Stp1/IreP family PP2C-type Ser/Thr phosphatase [Clostridiales bacterium]HPU67500.1 Stp1/IreP family PP2C-type Ser/Thr phosphatase [Clostridiales bacterium]
MKISAKTDRGRVRPDNQDSYAVGEMTGGVAWAVVCDGMGGAAGGYLASTESVRIISERLASSYRPGMNETSVKNILVSAINAANVNIYDISSTNSEFSGMGTTVVAAIVCEDTVYIAHVGDSRAYIINSQGVRQLTRDHSLVQNLLDVGKLSPNEAKEHPYKNVITRALGVNETVEVDFCVESFSKDDALLICTDGLTNFVSTDDILKSTADGKVYEFAERLVTAANNNGGGDNITAVVISH